jgi:hypothetical protein
VNELLLPHISATVYCATTDPKEWGHLVMG